MYLLAGFILPIISYILQVYPRIFNKYFGVDVWTLLIETELIRKNNHKIPSNRIKKGFIINGFFDYPPVFLILLSFFSRRTLLKYQGFISPIFDAILNLSIFFIVFSLTDRIEIAIIAQLVYAIIPVVALENSALLPRSLGYSLFMLSFFFLILFTSGGNSDIRFLIVAIALSSLTLLSHKFATQSLFFLTIFFTVFERNLFYSANLLIAFLLAIALSKGYYIKVLKSHIGIIQFWAKNYKDRFSHQIYGNISVKKNPDLIGTIYKLLSNLAPITLFSANPWMASAFTYILIEPDLPSYTSKLVAWILFFYVLAVITLMFKRLTPIGEGYRYIEMTTLPSAVLTSLLFFEILSSELKFLNLAFPLIIFGNFLVVIYMQRKAVINDSNRSMTDDLNKMFDFINTLNKPRVMCIPHQITTMTVYHTNANVLVNFDVEGLYKMQNFYPVVKEPLEKIFKDYEINFLLVRESFVKIKDLKLRKYKIIKKSGDVSLLKVGSGS